MSVDTSIDHDDDRTDELARLPASWAAPAHRTAGGPHQWEDTGEHTALLAPADSEAAKASAAVIAGLKAELEHWSTRCHAAEKALAEQNSRIAELDAALVAARRSLDSEIEHTRQQVAAHLRELQDRDERLRVAAEAVTRLQGELAARDERIEGLQRELDERLGALQKLNAMDLSLQGLEAKIAGRLATPADSPSPAPALLCLTGEAPRHIALRSANIMGRGSHCDVQIRTHYVSREHARIVVTTDGATIEDLGSRNGVYVNAVKVDRQRLQQGDLIEIGETQFRYVESVAH